MISRDRLLLLVTGLIASGLLAQYVLTAKTVTVSLDGVAATVRTRCTTIGGLLAEMGVNVSEQDTVAPPASAVLSPGDQLVIKRARHVVVHADGRVIEAETQANTVADVLAESGVRLQGRDLVFVNGKATTTSSTLSSSTTSFAPGVVLASYAPARVLSHMVLPRRPSAAMIIVRRAVAVDIVVDETTTRVMSPARTVGEALFAEGIYIYAADRVSPSLDTLLADGMRITVRRAKVVTITADGRTFLTRTQAATVAAMLVEEGVAANGNDYSTPPLQTPVRTGMEVKLTRVREETYTEAESVPFKITYEPDKNMDLDQQRLVRPGKQGVRKRTTRVVYEDGKEVRRFLDREWIDEEPVPQVVAYGTRVTVRTLNTPDGPIEYWRAVRVWTTYYTAATSGKTRDHPAYGITRTGRWATKGIIAVDPRYIRLHTPMYVPGYGFGAAEDTGGLILGMHIDLCFDEDDPHPFNLGWVTIYLLTPVPDDIPWIMADFPKERK